ncbi:MAG: hypothetical protein QNK89_02195 [Lacinutrix sp.]
MPNIAGGFGVMLFIWDHVTPPSSVLNTTPFNVPKKPIFVFKNSIVLK